MYNANLLIAPGVLDCSKMYKFWIMEYRIDFKSKYNSNNFKTRKKWQKFWCCHSVLVLTWMYEKIENTHVHDVQWIKGT